MTSATESFALAERASKIVWHACADEGAWIGAAVDFASTVLRSSLVSHASIWLLLSGGTTPAPVYRALASQELEWSRIVVSLVDDRDVDPYAEGSNERLVRHTLLRGAAAAARFQPLHKSGQSLDDAVRASNTAWLRGHASSRDACTALAMLGMGDDGHTASLFPGAVDLDAAFASTEPYVSINATRCAGAGKWPYRISLTPAGMAQAQHQLLLIRGEQKRATFERALESGDPRDMPIRIAIDSVGSPLHVYWTP